MPRLPPSALALGCRSVEIPRASRCVGCQPRWSQARTMWVSHGIWCSFASSCARLRLQRNLAFCLPLAHQLTLPLPILAVPVTVL